MPKPTGQLQYRAEVMAVKFEKDGFAICVCDMTANNVDMPLVDQPIEYGETVKGQFGVIRVGAAYDVEGTWTEDKRYGPQFTLRSAVIAVPTDAGALAGYLASSVPGVGAITAERIAKACPGHLAPVDWLRTEPFVAGVTAAIIQRARMKIESDGASAAAELELRELLAGLEGFGPKRISKAVHKWGASVADKIRADPYLLRQLDGVGFQLADRVARERCAIEPDSPVRLAAGVAFVLEEAEREGHCGLTPRKAEESAVELLGVRVKDVTHHGAVIDSGLAYRPVTLAAEIEIADVVYGWVLQEEAAHRKNCVSKGNLDPSQRDAADLLAWTPIGCMIGGPGTGKTTTIRSIIAAVQEAGDRVALAAPTGKAARRMIEQTGMAARTLHSMLRITPDADADGGFEPREEFNAADLIIVDEASMLDIWLARALLTSLRPGQRVILVGDINQLCPVGPGAVLRDLVATGVVPVGRLTEVHRQEGGNLLDLIHAIGDGRDDEVDELLVDNLGGDLRIMEAAESEKVSRWIEQLVAKGGPLASAGHDESAWQVVSPVNDRGPLSVASLNLKLQDALREPALTPKQLVAKGWKRDAPPRFRPADRIVLTKNDEYKRADGEGTIAVVNGEQGKVIALDHLNEKATIRLDTGEILVPMRSPHMQLAYCVTVHKAQGSEWPVVLLPMHRSLPSHMMTREWVYTAVSRASEVCVILGDPMVLIKATTRKAPRRFGRLRNRLLREVREEEPADREEPQGTAREPEHNPPALYIDPAEVDIDRPIGGTRWGSMTFRSAAERYPKELSKNVLARSDEDRDAVIAALSVVNYIPTEEVPSDA